MNICIEAVSSCRLELIQDNSEICPSSFHSLLTYLRIQIEYVSGRTTSLLNGLDDAEGGFRPDKHNRWSIQINWRGSTAASGSRTRIGAGGPVRENRFAAEQRHCLYQDEEHPALAFVLRSFQRKSSYITVDSRSSGSLPAALFL